MGADGYLTLGQINPFPSRRRAELTDAPMFKVLSRVAFLAAWPRRFGRWVNFGLTHDELQQQLEGSAGGYEMIPLFRQGEPQIGLAMIELDWLEKLWAERLDRWQAGDDRASLNGLGWAESIAGWDQITPGYWAAIHYTESGGPARFDWTPPRGITIGQQVEFHLWT